MKDKTKRKIRNKWKTFQRHKLVRKIGDKLGYIAFLIFFVIIAPILMIYGALVILPRYYFYVSRTVHDQSPKKYYF